MTRTRLRARPAGRLFAHVETWRPYTAFYVGLVGLAGATLQGPASGWQLGAAWAVPTLAWVGGLYGGDFFDRRLDAVAKPHRPIPSGRLPAAEALLVFLACIVAGAAVSAALNWRTAGLVAVAAAGGVLYSTVLKGRGLSGNLVRGGMTALAFCYGEMMVSDVPSARVLLVALVFWAHDAASNLVGALRDVDGDRAGGYRTFPVVHGPAAAIRVVQLLLVLAYASAAATPAVLGRSWSTGCAVGLLLAATSAVWAVAPLSDAGAQLRRVAFRTHTVLVLTRIVLAGSLLVLALGWIGVPICLAALIATWVSQRLLRERHEFASPSAGPSTGVPSLTDDGEAAVVPTPEQISTFVDEQLALLDRQEDLLAGLRHWRRLIIIRLQQPLLEIRLQAADGRLIRTGTGIESDDVDRVEIDTTGEVFAEVFLTGATTPRRALLARRLHVHARPADLMRVHQVFRHFVDQQSTPPEQTSSASPVAAPSGIQVVEPPVTWTTVRALAPSSVVVSDTTLRDGEQMPGARFSPSQKRALARELSHAGVALIEAGYPAVSTEEAETVRTIVDDLPDVVVQVIARPRDEDVEAALATGAHSVAVFIGTSQVHLDRKLRRSVDELLPAVDRAIRRVKRAGRQAVFAAEDASRSDPEVLARFCATAAAAGADTIGLADTVGTATPESMHALVSWVSDQCGLPIAVHCHDDLGLATANSLAGVRAGASGVQCSVLGVGERAGNAALEQVVMALHTQYGYDTGIDTQRLVALAERVAALTRTSTQPYQPVVGAHAFTHESGLHVDGLTQCADTYEPYPPELLGRERLVVLGKHSGLSAILAVARSGGIELDLSTAREVLRAVKADDRERAGHEHDPVATLLRHLPPARQPAVDPCSRQGRS